MQPPPPGAYPPPPNGAGRGSMPPTPMPPHAHAYAYHQSPQCGFELCLFDPHSFTRSLVPYSIARRSVSNDDATPAQWSTTRYLRKRPASGTHGRRRTCMTDRARSGQGQWLRCRVCTRFGHVRVCESSVQVAILSPLPCLTPHNVSLSLSLSGFFMSWPCMRTSVLSPSVPTCHLDGDRVVTCFILHFVFSCVEACYKQDAINMLAG